MGHRSCLHGTVQFCTFGLVTAYAANPLRSACHFHQETVSWTLGPSLRMYSLLNVVLLLSGEADKNLLQGRLIDKVV